MRKLREKKQGAEYHITGRFNQDRYVFVADEVKELYLQLLREAKLKYTFLR